MQGPAIDTHAHVFRQGLALADTRRHTPDYDATLTQYLALLDAHGVARGVLVQPSFLGTDNSHLVARAPPAGCAGRRGVARHRGGGSAGAGRGRRGRHPAQPDRPAPARAGPARLAGIAGARQHAGLACGSASAGEPPARYHAGPAAGCRVVIDHFGPGPGPGHRRPRLRLSAAPGRQRPGLGQLAAPYRNWPAPDCARAGREAARLLLDAYTPDRLMWGSDWPHTEHRHLASYTAATQWLDAWIDDARAQAVLADTRCGCFNSLEKHDDPSVQTRRPPRRLLLAAGLLAGGAGGLGRLPRARDHAGGHLPARRHGRRRRPPDRPQAGRRAGPARGDREPWRRGRHDRRRGRRQGPARRLR